MSTIQEANNFRDISINCHILVFIVSLSPGKPNRIIQAKPSRIARIISELFRLLTDPKAGV
jgi:hypothetical protein